MLHNSSSLFNNLILDIVDNKLKQSLSFNSEIQKQNSNKNKYTTAFTDLLDRIDKADKEIIDDYLSLNNCINSLLYCDLYKYGFYDCVDLLKDLKVI